MNRAAWRRGQGFWRSALAYAGIQTIVHRHKFAPNAGLAIGGVSRRNWDFDHRLQRLELFGIFANNLVVQIAEVLSMDTDH